MFYKTKLRDHIRVSPDLFESKTEEAILKSIRKDYEGHISPKFGFVIDVLSIDEVKDGIIVPGDGAAYYETVFELLTFKPELQEVVLSKVRDIAEFGAFMTMGPADGMIHISQTMDDYVSFSKEKTLTGKDSKKTLRVNDKCRARIIAVSYKDLTNPKVGLTMRQENLGRIDWQEEAKEEKPKEKKEKQKKKTKR